MNQIIRKSKYLVHLFPTKFQNEEFMLHQRSGVNETLYMQRVAGRYLLLHPFTPGLSNFNEQSSFTNSFADVLGWIKLLKSLQNF